ncbi:MAG: hypothetical protein DUW69_002162 [Verrucomicrobia bacterium]|jgi:uncharacterized protein|nr:MAG: hypothetical protein DUW69_002162 [Verrucomicrobiota bacterium]
MRQQWVHLLFLHWAWDAAAVQDTLPAGLTVDTFEGRAWIGLVPFFMRRVRPAGFPAVPGVSNFLELNVRTYVHDAAGRPGVWFYSLDCNQWLAVKVARGLFHLPYEHAVMSADISVATGEVDYAAGRCGQAEESRFLYRATGPGRAAEPGSLEFFLVERYTLFAHAARRQRLYAGRVAHEPYRVAGAEVPVWDDGMMRLAGFDAAGRPPDHRCTAAAVDVEVFPLRRVG